jgi:tetratricopeptide (TPR) repeat protein
MTAKQSRERQVGLALQHLEHGDAAMDQGDLAAALGHFRQALAGFRELALAGGASPAWQTQVAESQMRIGTALLRQGRTEAALACLADSRATGLQLLAARDAKAGPHGWWIATHLARLGETLFKEGDAPGQALEHYQAALDLWRTLAAANPGNGYDGEVATTLILIGIILEKQGDLPGALERFREALSLRQREAAIERSTQREWQAALAFAHAHVGAVLEMQQDLDGALASHRSSAAILRTLTSVEPDRTDWQEALACGLKSIGDVLEATGALDEAVAHHEQCVSILRGLLANGRGDRALRSSLAYTLKEIADMRQGLNDLPGALRSCQGSQRQWQELLDEEPDQLEWLECLAASHAHAGDLMEELEDLAGALRSCQQAVAVQRRLVAAEPRLEWRRDLGLSLDKLEYLQDLLLGAAVPEGHTSGSVH